MIPALPTTAAGKAFEYGVAGQRGCIRTGSAPDESESKKPDLLWSSHNPGERYRVCAAVNKEEGEFVSYCLSLPGAVSCGDTAEEAIENLRKAVAGCILSYGDAGQEIPWTDASRSKDEYESTEWIDVDI